MNIVRIECASVDEICTGEGSGLLMTQFVEIVRQEGEEFRRVLLSVTVDGVRLYTQDIGPTAKQVWGRDGEYEFWVDVEGHALPALLFALLREKYAGQLDAVDQFREFCERNDIPHEFTTWS